MRLPENRRYSMGVSKNHLPRSTTSENDFLDTHLVSTIFVANLTQFCYIIKPGLDSWWVGLGDVDRVLGVRNLPLSGLRKHVT